MNDKELQFDREKHILYSREAKQVIRDRLAARYGPEQAEQLWEQTQKNYLRFVDSIPYMGGQKNPQSGSVYDCAALFAYYEAVPDKPTLAELEQMNLDLFLPPFERLSKIRLADLNRPWVMQAAGCIWKVLARRSQNKKEEWPGNYDMEVLPAPEGKRYVFYRCPIAELARELGYTYLMPALCNPDYPMLAAVHGTLIRATTCAFGDCCDYWIVGSDSPAAAQHPLKKNEAGFLYNT